MISAPASFIYFFKTVITSIYWFPFSNFFSFFFSSDVRTEGKGSRPYVFTLTQNTPVRIGIPLDIAANTQEELKEWVFKIREVTLTSEAKVNIQK